MLIPMLISAGALVVVAVVVWLIMSGPEGSKTLPPRFDEPMSHGNLRGKNRTNGEDD